MGKKGKHSFADTLFSSAFIHNPVLVQMVGLGAVVAVATTLKTALLLSAVFFPVMIITQVIANLFLKHVPRWIRVALYLIIGTAIVAPIMYLIDRFVPDLRIGAGIYLGLTAASSITALHCEKFAVKTDFKLAFFDAVASSVGYGAVIILVGFLRELLGTASVLGKQISIPFTFPSLLMPFGGFIVLAFCAAALRALINKRFPEYSEETELKIKKTSVIVSKKNLYDKEAAEIERHETADAVVEEADETVEPHQPDQPESTDESTEEEPLLDDRATEEILPEVPQLEETFDLAEEQIEEESEVEEQMAVEEKFEPQENDVDLEPIAPMDFEEEYAQSDKEKSNDYDVDEIIKAFEKREFPDVQTNSDDDEFGILLSQLFNTVEFDVSPATKDEKSEDGEGLK